MTKRIHARPVIPRRLVVNERERDKIYDASYIGAGNTGHRKAKNDNGALSRVKPGSAAVFICELCDITGMLLVELRAHYRNTHEFHRSRS